ncbi:hypothetical protein SAMN05216184_10726 [Georgenia satyanarayanai]|uniref:Uncharacterized protein n=1 Tax=Georgenia satyanarayanai TaxID=860221 RepID=A0A2Y9AKX7_9MICO|nr:hypothetical protein [Georgenia satyanarayanai]PYF99317.1 hypothetical protein A8987_10726 [Georgenia satyanarayanai]SSA43129.1 hypothetical protein SAMN05216184_10726 [Georgenia satyanarayanai]
MNAATPPVGERPVMSRGDRVALGATAAVAALVAVGAAVGGVMSVVQALRDDPLTLHGFPLVNARTPEFTEPFGQVSEAWYESAALTVTGLPTAARWPFAAQSAVTALAVVGVSLALLWLALRVLRNRPFGRSMTAALVASAVLIIVGGTVSQLLGAAGNAAVVDHLGTDITGGADTARPEGYEGLMTFALDLSLAPVGVGLALAVVALAFQIGARLQRDTEGLV